VVWQPNSQSHKSSSGDKQIFRKFQMTNFVSWNLTLDLLTGKTGLGYLFFLNWERVSLNEST